MAAQPSPEACAAAPALLVAGPICKRCGGPRDRRGRGVRLCSTCDAPPPCKVCGEPTSKDGAGNYRPLCGRDECRREARTAAAFRAGKTRSLKAVAKPLPAERACSKCRKVQPLDEEHFKPTKRDEKTGAVAKFHYYCRPCLRAFDAKQREKRSEEQRERNRENQRRYYQSLTPDQMRLRAERQRMYVNKNPEVVAEASRRYRERRQADPERHRHHLETRRLAHALRVERSGGQLRAGRATAPSGGRLPGRPLAAAIRAAAVRAGVDLQGFCIGLGIADRLMRVWERGGLARLDVADRVVTSLDALWWEVYDPEEFPGIFAGRQRDDVLQWLDAVDAAARLFEGEGAFTAV